jgi:flagellar biogenesis protein FliO
MELLRQLLALALVFALLAGALWLLRRRGLARWSARAVRRPGSGGLEVIDRLAISSQHALHLVRVGEQLILVATHGASCTLLGSVASRAPESQPSPGGPPR